MEKFMSVKLSKNLSPEELKEIIKLGHSNGIGPILKDKDIEVFG